MDYLHSVLYSMYSMYVLYVSTLHAHSPRGLPTLTTVGTFLHAQLSRNHPYLVTEKKNTDSGRFVCTACTACTACTLFTSSMYLP